MVSTIGTNVKLCLEYCFNICIVQGALSLHYLLQNFILCYNLVTSIPLPNSLLLLLLLWCVW